MSVGLDSKTYEEYEIFIASILQEALENDNKDQCRAIFEICDYERLYIDSVPALTNLFINKHVSKELLNFCISCFPEKQAIDYIYDLINCINDEKALSILKIIEQEKEISLEDWKKVLHVIDLDLEEGEYPNQLFRNFIEKKIELEHYKPIWVKPFLEPEELPIIPYFTPCTDKAVDIIVSDMKKNNLAVFNKDKIEKEENVKNTLRTIFSISSVSERMIMLGSPEIFDDTNYFREFGPINSKIYSNIEHNEDQEIDECDKYGGCRMFTCIEFENGEFEDVMNYIDHDWFKGYCDECESEIAKRHFAVRCPLKDGGWKGCYCSFLCVTNKEPEIITKMKLIESQLVSIGIRDR
jgi:hypothetical protein